MTGKRIILMLAVLAVAAPSAPAESAGESTESTEETFLLGATDIPLMPGLTGDEAAGVFFDKPAGRIMIARPGGCVDPEEAKRFYAATLPQLGWLPVAGAPGMTYLREGERLTLEFVAGSAGDCTTLGFVLNPNSGEQ